MDIIPLLLTGLVVLFITFIYHTVMDIAIDISMKVLRDQYHEQRDRVNNLQLQIDILEMTPKILELQKTLKAQSFEICYYPIDKADVRFSFAGSDEVIFINLDNIHSELNKYNQVLKRNKK